MEQQHQDPIIASFAAGAAGAAVLASCHVQVPKEGSEKGHGRSSRPSSADQGQNKSPLDQCLRPETSETLHDAQASVDGFVGSFGCFPRAPSYDRPRSSPRATARTESLHKEGDRHKAQHGRLQPLQGEAHLDMTTSPDLPLAQEKEKILFNHGEDNLKERAANSSPQAIASTARPPMFWTSITSDRISFEAYQPRDGIQISADLVHKEQDSAAGIVTHRSSEAGHARSLSAATGARDATPD